MTNRRCHLLALALAVLMVASCGKGSLSGDYVAKDGKGMVEKVAFLPGNKAEVDLGLAKSAGTYSVDGKTVKITLTAGLIYEFTLDTDGCLTGNPILGEEKLCKQ